jgi:single-strand DNA-binding protein
MQGTGMSGSVNKAIVVGHLGKDPDVKRNAQGQAIAQFSVATGEHWRDKQTGERREKTDWHRVVIFNEALVKVAEQYLKKGSKVYVEGKMQTRKWTDQGGTERYTTEIVLANFGAQLHLLDRREQATPSEDDYGSEKTTATPGVRPSLKDEIDDEIPF